MKYEEFTNKAQAYSKEYRAECHSKNRHWKGVWRKSYVEAFNDGDKHRYGNNGNNQYHDIIIIEKVYSKANL